MTFFDWCLLVAVAWLTVDLLIVGLLCLAASVRGRGRA